MVKESLIGGSVSQVKGESNALTKVNCFTGQDPSKWRRRISTYNMVSLGEVYKGIELKLKAHGGNVEKLFYVKPGADPGRIRVRLDGVNALTVNESGELEIETDLGVMKFTKPVAYQEEKSKKTYVQVAYAVKGCEYGFDVDDFNRGKGLVIDPLLASTFFGGSYSDAAFSLSMDRDGNVYVAGHTVSSDFPTTPGAY
ncbi:MAG: SBBP repeat-containing protein [Thermodesulfobacteriota bacterium]|nr:SBBP repeat-containing protein [Thermodesulfobacteriota bacterium]